MELSAPLCQKKLARIQTTHKAKEILPYFIGTITANELGMKVVIEKRERKHQRLW